MLLTQYLSGTASPAACRRGGADSGSSRGSGLRSVVCKTPWLFHIHKERQGLNTFSGSLGLFPKLMYSLLHSPTAVWNLNS